MINFLFVFYIYIICDVYIFYKGILFLNAIKMTQNLVQYKCRLKNNLAPDSFRFASYLSLNKKNKTKTNFLEFLELPLKYKRTGNKVRINNKIILFMEKWRDPPPSLMRVLMYMCSVILFCLTQRIWKKNETVQMVL